MAITRTTLTDDSGSGTDGTIWNNARLQLVYDAIETNWIADSYTPTWGNTGTANTTTDLTITGTYFKIGKRIDFTVQMTWGAGTASGNGVWTLTLPLTANSNGVYGGVDLIYSDANTGNVYRGTALTSSSTVIQLYNNATPLAGITSTVPFTWASGDQVFLQGTFYIA